MGGGIRHPRRVRVSAGGRWPGRALSAVLVQVANSAR